MVRHSLLLALAAFLCSVWGCGQSGPPRYALSGKVSYDGQPVEDGSIKFFPADSETATGVSGVITEGQYEIPRAQGPTAGNHKVWIEARKPSGIKIPSEDGGPSIDQLVQYIPAVYNVRSNLVEEITDDRDDLDFMLEKVEPEPRRR